MTVTVSSVTTVDTALLQLLDEALAEMAAHRGGVGLLRDIGEVLGSHDPGEMTRALVSSQGLLGVYHDGEMTGFAAYRSQPHPVILGIYVTRSSRRNHQAKKLLKEILRGNPQPKDAWVLPGDRATKSLYESAGWKARRLTMSGE